VNKAIPDRGAASYAVLGAQKWGRYDFAESKTLWPESITSQQGGKPLPKRSPRIHGQSRVTCQPQYRTNHQAPPYESDPSLILSMTCVKHPGQYVWVSRQSAGFTPCVFRYERCVTQRSSSSVGPFRLESVHKYNRREVVISLSSVRTAPHE